MSRRIALISDHASPLSILGGVDSGGQNVYVGQVAKHLAALGYSVDVFTRRTDPSHPEVIIWTNGVRVVNISAGPAKHIPKEELLPHMPEFSQNFFEFCSRQRKSYDAVHANFWMSGIVAMEIKKVLGIPFTITFHALGRVRREYQGGADHFPDARFDIEDRIVRCADRLVAECPQDRDDLIRLYHGHADKITVISCGFDPAEFWPIGKAEARAAIGCDGRSPLLLQLGRIVPRKGIDTAIRAFAWLRKCHGVAARMIIVGGETGSSDKCPSAEMFRLKDLCEEEGVRDYVLFAGPQPRERLRYYYSAADVFVTTPWYEPFGITPLEAMACGTPVVGSDVGGIKYTVVDQVTGFLVPAKDHVATGSRLAELFCREGLIEQLGNNGRNRVNELFTWQKVVRQLCSLYSSMTTAEDWDRDEQGLGPVSMQL